MTDFSLIPPSSTDAEVATLGSMMLCGDDRELFDKIVHTVAAEDFYVDPHGEMYTLMREFRESGRPADAIILNNACKERKMAYWTAHEIGRVLNTVFTCVNGPTYAAEVAKLSRHRRIIRLAETARAAAYAATEDPDGIVATLMDGAQAVQSAARTMEFVSMRDLLMSGYECLEGGIPMLKTGLKDFDDQLGGGIGLGEYLLVAARPSMGKSVIAKTLAEGIAANNNGAPVGYISVEEQLAKISRNYFASWAPLDNHRTRSGRLTREEFDRVAAVIPVKSKLPIIFTQSARNIDQVLAAIATLVHRDKIKCVVIDHLHHLGAGSMADERTVIELKKMSHALNESFKRFGIAGVVLAQLNRGNEKGEVRRPRMSDIRECGDIEQHGDTIVLLHREDYYRKDRIARGEEHPTHMLEAIFEKQRDGRVGVVKLHFSGKYQRVADWSEFDGGAGHYLNLKPGEQN